MNTLSSFVRKFSLMNKFGYTAVHSTIDFFLLTAIIAGILTIII